MIRFLFSLIAGGAVTFGLFYFMAFLISGGADRNTEQKEQIIVEIMTNPPESKVQERKRVPPPPPPPPAAAWSLTWRRSASRTPPSRLRMARLPTGSSPPPRPSIYRATSPRRCKR